MKPLTMTTQELGDDLMIGTVQSASQRIREAIRKEVPNVHPVIEQLAIGTASTASTLATAIPILSGQMSSPAYQDVLDRLTELLINNSISAVYQAAKMLNYSRDDTRKALEAAGTAGFSLVRELRESQDNADDLSKDWTLN